MDVCFDIMKDMKQLSALKTILGIAVFGLLFSGYLSYQEFFGQSDEAGCSALGTPGTILGYPPCVYGCLMYLIVLIVAFLGIRGKKG